MLQRLYADNYKCLVNFELPFQDVTLLLGPNGVGKSSVLDVMFGLRQILIEGVKVTHTDAFPTRTLTRWQSRDLQVFEVRVVLDGEVLEYRLEIEHERSTKRARIRLERLTGDDKLLFKSELGQVHLYRDDHSEGPGFTVDWSESFLARVAPRDDNSRLTRFKEFIENLTVCRLHPEAFRTESTKEGRVLERDGSNFVDWYRHMVQERTDLAVELTSTLRATIDDFRAIRMEKVGAEARALLVGCQKSDESYSLRFDEVSEGQRALIVLYSLVGLAEGKDSALFLDEPDNYVALPEIQPWLMELSDACGEAGRQAVVCSHHPELIDYLGGEHGLLLNREESGVVTVRKLGTRLVENGLKLSETISRGWQ